MLVTSSFQPHIRYRVNSGWNPVGCGGKSLYLYALKGYNYPVPTVLRIRGFRFFFFSNELGEPPHIHVESDDKYAKFWLEPLQLARSVGYSARELSAIGILIAQNTEILRRSWDEYFKHKD